MKQGMEGMSSVSEYGESSFNSSRSDFYCECGMRAIVAMSWTEINPERRFYGCPLYKQDKKGKKGCGYFRWYEDPVCPTILVPMLLKKTRRLKQEIQDKEIDIADQQVQIKRLKMGLFVSWGLFFPLIVAMVWIMGK